MPLLVIRLTAKWRSDRHEFAYPLPRGLFALCSLKEAKKLRLKSKQRADKHLIDHLKNPTQTFFMRIGVGKLLFYRRHDDCRKSMEESNNAKGTTL